MRSSFVSTGNVYSCQLLDFLYCTLVPFCFKLAAHRKIQADNLGAQFLVSFRNSRCSRCYLNKIQHFSNCADQKRKQTPAGCNRGNEALAKLSCFYQKTPSSKILQSPTARSYPNVKTRHPGCEPIKTRIECSRFQFFWTCYLKHNGSQ